MCVAITGTTSDLVAGTTSLVWDTPTHKEGDLLLAGVITRGNYTLTDPSGWTLQSDTGSTSASDHRTRVYYRTAGSSEPATYTWTSSGPAGHHALLGIALNGVDPTTPISDDSTNTTSSSTSPQWAAVTNPADGAVILFGAHRSDATDTNLDWTDTSPSGYTKQEEVVLTTGGSSVRTSGFMTVNLFAATGTTGTLTGAIDTAWDTFNVAIAVAPDPNRVFYDTFTNTASTLLESHTAMECGISWTRVWGSTGEGVEVNSSNQAEATGGSSQGAIYTAETTYDSADYIVKANFADVSIGADDSVYLLARVQDVDNMYALKMQDRDAASSSRLYKKVSGTWTALGTAFTTPGDGAIVELSVVGDQIKAIVDGTTEDTVTDSSITATGKAGLAFGGDSELENSGDDMTPSNALDDFEVTTQESAAPSFTPVVMVVS